MTKPINRLDEFQSHSVHYVMLAARTTEDLRRFTENSDAAQSETLQAIDNCKRIGDEVKGSGVSRDSVFLMIDTRRFSQFTIDQFELDTKISGFSVPGSDSPNAIGSDLTFSVLDSTGISFANFLQYLMDQRLKVSFDGMTILIRVMFIGHLADGSTKIVQAIGIPAMLTSIQVDLNDTKGVYACKCTPLIGMISNSQHNARWTSIGSSTNYFSGHSANTLGAVVKSFEGRLNDESLTRFKELNASTTGSGGVQKNVPHFGRPVQFMITLPKTWETFTFSGPTQGAATEINFNELVKKETDSKRSAAEQQKKAQTNAAAPAKDSFLSVDPTLTITEVLDVIFSQTLGVLELANFKTGQKTDSIKFYKQLITVTSDDLNYTVHIDVVEFTVPNVELAEKGGVGQYDDMLLVEVHEPGRKVRKLPRNFLEFDYIFSGTNIDVLSLDLKIENLNILLAQGTKVGQTEMFTTASAGQKQSDGETAGSNQTTAVGRGAKDPVLMCTPTSGQRTNFSNLAGNTQSESGASPTSINQQYTRNLSDFYNMRGQAKMTIRGNPDYLERIVLTSLPEHLSSVTDAPTARSSTNENVKTQWRAALEEKILRTTPGISKNGNGFQVKALSGPSFITTPIFVKVNVYGPNVDFITLDPIAGQDFSRKLFNDNFYFTYAVKSKIEGSKFTQEFELQNFSVYGHPNQAAQGQNQSTVKEV